MKYQIYFSLHVLLLRPVDLFLSSFKISQRMRTKLAECMVKALRNTWWFKERWIWKELLCLVWLTTTYWVPFSITWHCRSSQKLIYEGALQWRGCLFLSPCVCSFQYPGNRVLRKLSRCRKKLIDYVHCTQKESSSWDKRQKISCCSLIVRNSG